MEGMGLLASCIGVITLIQTREATVFSARSGGQIFQRFLVVLLTLAVEHLFMLASPTKARQSVKKQAVIFQRKHTYIMTGLYLMCFGSFIGYSASFPLLIKDLFGYRKGDGCVLSAGTGSFVLGMDAVSCVAEGGSYENGYQYPNPEAPSAFKVAWLGAFVGSVIRRKFVVE